MMQPQMNPRFSTSCRRQLTMALLLALFQPPGCEAFVSESSAATTALRTRIPQPPPLLQLAATTPHQQHNNNVAQRQDSNAQNKENLELLAQTIELQRLQKAELAAQQSHNPQHTLPKLALCRASGYGDDLDAYEQAWEAGHMAREALITRNMGLVHFVVHDIVGTRHHRKRSLQSLSFDDLIQEGAIGLSRAVDRWNPDIGGKFSTYAVYWIRAAVFRGIAERDDLVRVPVHVSSAVNKMTKAARQMGLDLEGIHTDITTLSPSATSSSSSWKEAQAAKSLAEKAGLSEAQLEHTLQVKRRRSRGGIRSFETWMQQGKDLSSDHSVTTSTPAGGSLDLEHIKTELAKFLRPNEVEALSLRYGLTQQEDTKNISSNASNNKRLARDAITAQGRWGEAMTFVEVGKYMQVSAEYGRRLCHKALSKLRLAHEQGELEPSVLTL